METCLVLITLSLCVHLVSGQVMGATGATGQRGQPGLPGPEGQTGASGPEGPPGPPGLPAFQVQYDIERWSGTGGWPGPSGPTGATGMRGAEGATGATGPPGWVGSTGATGMIGGTGVTGATGAPGVIGATGWVGTAYSFYLRGAPGVKGPPGATGAPGSEGLLGAKGMMGLPGLAGPAGPPGAPGQLIFDQPTAQSPVCPEFEPLVRAYQVVYREWDEPWVRHVLNPYVLAIMLGWLLLLTVCVIIAVVAGTCCDRPAPAKIIKDIEMNPAPAYDQIDAVPQSETHSKYKSDADFVDKYDDLVDAKLADDDQKADVKPDF